MKRLRRDDGRREAFSGLVRAHGVVMVKVARHLLGAGDAEDAVQSAILSAWKHYRGLDGLQQPRAWLIRFIVNECRNLMGLRARRPIPLALDAEIEEPVTGGDVVVTLQRELAYSLREDPGRLLDYVDEGLSRALRTIGEDERMTLLLRAVGSLTYKEIASVMEVPVGTVMSRLCRAREKVRAELGPSNERGRESTNAEGGCSSGGATP